jgi:Cu(I)/Ag(I) efflux system membrane fusion protein
MFVQGTITVPQPASVVIPATAVMDTGTRQVVWVESKPGVFLQREVKTGGRSGLEIQILSGLKAAEKVATTGSYLIDSEAQLSHGGTDHDKSAAVPPKPAHTPAHRD